MKQRRNNLFQIGLEVLMCVITFAMVTPFIIMISASFKAPLEIIQFPFRLWPKDFTFEYYSHVWEFGRIVTTSIVFLTLFTSSLIGYIFAKKQFRGRDKLFLLVISPLMIPFVVLLIPLYVEMVKLKLVNTYAGLILPSAISAYGIFLMRQFIGGLPSSLFDAAKIDGASELQVYFLILLPLCKPILAALGIFIFMFSWDSLLWPLVMITKPELKVIPLALTLISQSQYENFSLITAASTIVIIPVVIVYIFFQKNFVKGISLTGLKG